jgi:hypothetical protein
MLDEIAGRAVLVGDHEHFRLTAKLEIRYRKPVPSGELLRLRGCCGAEKRERRLRPYRTESSRWHDSC